MFGSAERELTVDPSVAVKATADALAALAEADVAGLTDGELSEALIEINRLRSMLDAQVVRLTGMFDGRRLHAIEAAKTTPAWVAWQCRTDPRRARADARHARALAAMPVTSPAFTAGCISQDHVRRLVHARSVDPEAFARDEEMLVDQAGQFRFPQFEVVVAYWRQVNDPDRAERDAQKLRERRAVHCAETLEGMRLLNATLDPIAGTLIANELHRLEKRLFDADWAETKARLGDQATLLDLPRSAAQRRADALEEMARRSAAKPTNAKEGRILVTVLVDYTTLVGRVCQLANGTVITPGQLLPWLTEAYVERVVFDGASRVLDIGRRQRFFKGATRRAVEVRDLTCSHPSCDVPYPECEVDHVDQYEDDGPTIQTNGKLGCPFHHHDRHRTPPPDQPPPDP